MVTRHTLFSVGLMLAVDFSASQSQPPPQDRAHSQLAAAHTELEALQLRLKDQVQPLPSPQTPRHPIKVRLGAGDDNSRYLLRRVKCGRGERDQLFVNPLYSSPVPLTSWVCSKCPAPPPVKFAPPPVLLAKLTVCYTVILLQCEVFHHLCTRRGPSGKSSLLNPIQFGLQLSRWEG